MHYGVPMRNLFHKNYKKCIAMLICLALVLGGETVSIFAFENNTVNEQILVSDENVPAEEAEELIGDDMQEVVLDHQQSELTVDDQSEGESVSENHEDEIVPDFSGNTLVQDEYDPEIYHGTGYVYDSNIGPAPMSAWRIQNLMLHFPQSIFLMWIMTFRP